jgi:hypothetical protein
MSERQTLAQRTRLSRWWRGESDSAECEDCGWAVGPGSDRVMLYAARRHAVDEGHNVIFERARFRRVSAV